jgi:hypothetical protein
MIPFASKNSCVDLTGVAVIDGDVAGRCTSNGYLDAQLMSLTTQRFRSSNDKNIRWPVISDKSVSTRPGFTGGLYPHPNSSYYAEQKKMYENEEKDC